jgi:uncharacterized protein YggU (UPF0235/DUF167 family)
VTSFYRAAGDGLRLRLKVKPQARHNAIDGVVPDVEGAALAVSVTALPEDGKANAALIALLAAAWDLPRSSFAVVQGATARRKLLRLAGDPGRLAAAIETWRAAAIARPGKGKPE